VAIHIALLFFRLVDAEAFWGVFEHLALVPANLANLEVQGLFTTIFVHDPRNIFHLLLNMMVLYFLGPTVELRLGTFRFTVLYIAAGLCGSIVYSIWALLLSDPTIPAIGASGAVLGVLAAFSILFPNVPVRLWMFAPMQGKNLVWLALGIDIVILFADPTVAVPAHMGGMLGAFLFLKRPWRPQFRHRLKWKVQSYIRRRR